MHLRRINTWHVGYGAHGGLPCDEDLERGLQSGLVEAREGPPRIGRFEVGHADIPGSRSRGNEQCVSASIFMS